MSRYYAIATWNEQHVLFKLKSTRKNLKKILSKDEALDISKCVDEILINNALDTNFYRAFKLDEKVNDVSESPILYWSFKEKSGPEKELNLLKLFTEDGDSLEKFDSDDDAKLWFEAIYKL